MTLSAVFSEMAARRTSISVYSSRPESDILAHIEEAYVDVDRRPLPDGARYPFLVLHDRDGFVVSVPLETVRNLFEPRIGRPWDADVPRGLLEHLTGVIFSSLDRRQLLGVSRDVEGRAWRVDRGTLHVGFQRLSAMVDQAPVYARLAAETDLEIHVYGVADREPPDVPGTTVHATSNDEIGRFWFLAFDGGGDDAEKCALVAEETEPGQYRGFWTRDPDLVDDALAHLRTAYG